MILKTKIYLILSTYLLDAQVHSPIGYKPCYPVPGLFLEYLYLNTEVEVLVAVPNSPPLPLATLHEDIYADMSDFIRFISLLFVELLLMFSEPIENSTHYFLTKPPYFLPARNLDSLDCNGDPQTRRNRSLRILYPEQMFDFN